MSLTVDSYSRFKLYVAEPAGLRQALRVDLDEIHDVTSNAGFQIDVCPRKRKDFIKENTSTNGWEQIILNTTYMPFKTLKGFITDQLAGYIHSRASTEQNIKGSLYDENEMFSPFMEPRILVYRKFSSQDSDNFLERFVSEMELAFKTTFTLFAFNQKELNNLLLEIFNLRRKNRVSSN